MKSIMVFLFAVLMLSTSYPQSQMVMNSKTIQVDTIFIDSLSVNYGSVVYMDKGTYNAILLQANDTNSAGFASDSIGYKIELLQAWNIDAQKVYLANSAAHPDTTTWPGSTGFTLVAALTVANMDTIVYNRDTTQVRNYNGDLIGFKYKTRLKSAAVTAPNAYKYYFISPDFTPGYCLRITGTATNAKRKNGSRLIIRYEQLQLTGQ
jgi:hypothetical protein